MTHLAYDKQRVAQQFSRAASSYAQHDQLQRQCAQLLMAYLPSQCESLLDLGCGPASHSAELAQHTELYLGMDIAPGMLAQAQRCQPHLRWLQGDAEQLPLQDNSVAVIVANLALQWCNQLAPTLQQCAQALKANGQLLFSTVLAGSMEPLMGAMQQLDGRTHHNHFLTEQQLVQQLAQVEGMQWHTEQQQFCLRYESLHTMLADIKGIGANYTVRAGSGYFGKTRWQALQKLLESYRTCDGELELNWYIALICGYKINKDQTEK
jgi:malonyl-CoA O-methyltransferase